MRNGGRKDVKDRLAEGANGNGDMRVFLAVDFGVRCKVEYNLRQ